MIISGRTKYFLLIITLLFFGAANAEEGPWISVEGGTWRPPDRVLSKVKIDLEPYMKSQEKFFGRALKKWNTYRFQYRGEEEKGRKFVYINAFCNFYNPIGVDLKQNFVFVDDGGSCFFQVKYDPVADKFYDVFINGEA